MSAIRRFHCIPECNLFQIKWGGVCHLFILIPQLYFHELPRKYPQEKILDLQNAYMKEIWTHEIPTTKNFGLTKYPKQKFWNHKIPTKEDFQPTNAYRKKTLDPLNTHNKNGPIKHP